MTMPPSDTGRDAAAIAAVEARLDALAFDALPASFQTDLAWAVRLAGLARRWRRRALGAAVLALLVGAGAGAAWARRGAPSAGATVSTATGTSQPEFMLVFEEHVAGRLALDADGLRVRGDEMNAWVASLRGGGRLISGRRLDDEAGQTVTAQGIVDRRGQVPPGTLTSGFMIVRAADYADAATLAAASPIVRHGGTIIVRALR